MKALAAEKAAKEAGKETAEKTAKEPKSVDRANSDELANLDNVDDDLDEAGVEGGEKKDG